MEAKATHQSSAQRKPETGAGHREKQVRAERCDDDNDKDNETQVQSVCTGRRKCPGKAHECGRREHSRTPVTAQSRHPPPQLSAGTM